MTVPLAHHMLVAALPFFGPMLIIAAVLTVMAVKDRRRQRHKQR
jgi:hypothetical protein